MFYGKKINEDQYQNPGQRHTQNNEIIEGDQRRVITKKIAENLALE